MTDDAPPYNGRSFTIPAFIDGVFPLPIFIPGYDIPLAIVAAAFKTGVADTNRFAVAIADKDRYLLEMICHWFLLLVLLLTCVRIKRKAVIYTFL